ncbi:unnamed protein product [Lactuca virosa]|uniref:TOD1/MUCI70 glycosyltransferase-like domain-containing protein n=1 Tax=Lactuca virosa TaxID=75947 RepID=A0AAU9PMU2_9ASTR|nr:unnamed protein product [Lactuca virosa]
MSVHCGFVRGDRPGRKSGYDIGDSYLLLMDMCHGVVVSSAIFETEKFLRNSDHLDIARRLDCGELLLSTTSLTLTQGAMGRFLWRENASFAISRHYKRFDVFLEAKANKAARKYNNASIDFQTDFYKREDLTCVVIREHIPISNLFTCLWFNEVDRFTSRDQISFSTVQDKIRSNTNWTVNMFWDCERRNFVVQHPPPPSLPTNTTPTNHPPKPLPVTTINTYLHHPSLPPPPTSITRHHHPPPPPTTTLHHQPPPPPPITTHHHHLSPPPPPTTHQNHHPPQPAPATSITTTPTTTRHLHPPPPTTTPTSIQHHSSLPTTTTHHHHHLHPSPTKTTTPHHYYHLPPPPITTFLTHLNHPSPPTTTTYHHYHHSSPSLPPTTHQN